MNCRTYQHELSQCLDGRLPSGRRGLLQQHLAECKACAAEWRALSAMRELVSKLPQERVSGDFRQGLWDRIIAGEGTPQGSFQEAVPFAAKARYVFSGAAAAALVLIAANFLGTRGAQPDRTRIDEPVTARVQPVADAPAAPNAPAAAPNAADVGSVASFAFGTPRFDTAAPSILSAMQPLTPDLVATETAKHFDRQLGNARTWAVQFQRRGSDNEAAVRNLVDSARSLQQCGNLLLGMRARDHLKFEDPDVDAELRVMVRLLDDRRLDRRSPETVREVVLPALQRGERLTGLPGRIYLQRVYQQGEDLRLLMQMTREQADLFTSELFLFMPPEACDGCQSINLQGTFVLHTECGPNLVIPRSRLVPR